MLIVNADKLYKDDTMKLPSEIRNIQKMGDIKKERKGYKMKVKTNKKFWVAVALLLCLISTLVSSAIQTSFGKVSIDELKIMDKSGYGVSVLLYHPDSATVDNKAPAIITVEGWYNNKEMQDLYSVEYARRGYVVIAVDMHGHGDSDNPYYNDLYTSAVGLDAAVELAGTLPYVDQSRIALTGHSSGGAACGMAVALDNERENPLISAVLFQASTWVDDTGVDHAAELGDRYVGIIADTYDEFFFWTTDENGNLKAPKDFLSSADAKNFVNFNNGAEEIDGDVVAGQYYENDDIFRVIYQPECTHPQVHFSGECVSYGIEFFENAFGAPNPLAADNQLWQIKTAFNAIGLVGIVVFLLSFVMLMLDTPYFGVLKCKETVMPAEVTQTSGKLWFWILLAACAVFSGVSYMWVINNLYSKTTMFFSQTGPLTMGVWSALSAAFTLILLVIYYFAYGRANGIRPAECGLKISLKNLWRTVVLAVLATSLAFLILSFSDYFFLTDYRLWVLTLKAFEADKVVLALHYLPFFLAFYIVNSIAVNCFNYNTIGKKANILILAAANILGAVGFIAIQYGTFFRTGLLKWYATEGHRISGIWLYPAIVYLFVTPFLSRFIYKRTKNPYIFAIINAIIITIMCVANTTTACGFVAASNY